jgi:molecular chaperone DnaK (HSP70)
VIERNTPVPIEQTRSFTTYQDHQESVKIRVYQGESRKAEENELLGQFEFGGLAKRPRGQVRIDVTFAINSDGLVNVTARDRDSGRQASTAITLSSGLSAQELESIVSERRTDRVASEPAPAAGTESELAVLDDIDVDALLEADVEELESDSAGAVTPLGDDLGIPLGGSPDEKLFESGDFDLSDDDTQGTREG